MAPPSEYGTYRLSYTPPEPTGDETYPLIEIKMSTSGEANLEQMLRFYEAFLSAAGYQLDGELQVVNSEVQGQGYRLTSVSSVLR